MVSELLEEQLGIPTLTVPSTSRLPDFMLQYVQHYVYYGAYLKQEFSALLSEGYNRCSLGTSPSERSYSEV